MDTRFGIETEIVEKALKNGIVLINNGLRIKPAGFLTLTYISQLNEFIITYGMNQQTSGFVYVKDFKNTWDLE